MTGEEGKEVKDPYLIFHYIKKCELIVEYTLIS